MTIFIFLFIKLHLSLLINGQTSVDCTEYESCFNQSIYFSNNNGFGCHGAKSCIDCDIDTTSLPCYGYGTCSGYKSKTYSRNNTYCFGSNSCLQENITSDGAILCYGYNTCLNNNIKMTSHLKPLWICSSIHSCSNTIFKCDTSYSDYYIINTRFIHMYFSGAFNGYNTSIYNNGNDIYILGQGYYSLYGLTVYCTSINSICIVNCYGNGCVGLTMVCDDSVLTCQYKCQDKECESYKHLVTIYNNSDTEIDSSYNKQNINDSIASYDEIAILVNDILMHYNKNLRLFPDSSYSINLIGSSGFCQQNSTLFFGDYLQEYGKTLIVNENENICCLGTYSCYKSMINTNVHDSNPTVYCGAVGSCSQSTFNNINSVYILGGIALYGSNVTDFDAVIVCSAVDSCAESFISNGSIVVCMSFKACSNTTITKVQTVIAIGYQSLYYCQLIDVETILLLSTQSLYHTTISDISISMEKFELYCQNDDSMCHEIANSTGTQLYCYDYTSISITIDGMDFNATNVSNLLYCSVNSNSPSISPTVSPTKSQFTHNIDLIVSWLETSTVQIGIVLATLTIVLVCVSMYFRKMKHSQTLKNFSQLNNAPAAGMTLLDDMSDNDKVKHDDEKSHNNNNNSKSIMTYVSGFGHKASHLVIMQLSFEVYDVFVDISYLLELYHNSLFEYFFLFVSSCIFTLVVNSIVLLYFLNNSFKYNKLFEQWFWNHSAIIISLMIFCLFTDVGMIVSLFTSQIFGHLIFYAPLNLHDIKTMKSASILSIFIEHLPQLIVQCLVYFNQSQSSWSTISITSLCVTCIDTFIACIKIVIWFVIMRQMKMDKK